MSEQPELRIDPLSGHRTIYTGAAGGPSLAAADTGAEAESGPSPRPGANPNRDLFWSAPALGSDIALPFPGAAEQALAELGAETIAAGLERWRAGIREHAGAACVHVGVDELENQAARRPRSTARLYALPFVPAALARERERFTAYATRTMGGNLLADLVQEEVRKRERIVAIDGEAVLISPYGARVPYQLLIAPRTPRPRFEDDGPTGAAMLHDALRRLAARLEAPVPLSVWVRTAPQGAEQFCWRIDVLTYAAGSLLERGAGLAVNALTPEQAAAELREL